MSNDPFEKARIAMSGGREALDRIIEQRQREEDLEIERQKIGEVQALNHRLETINQSLQSQLEETKLQAAKAEKSAK